ncbi:ATP-binding protein [Vulgatibacter incomptus]|uniref:ATP-binding protein n=1 Tax=Vulgatibacter incomptus TaxID=1391653 RepID=UPI0023E36908|nr:ATP-binding protein [Vulgatibacter incomptus]
MLRDPAGFEFINPGLLLVTPDQVWKGGVSEPRNPLVQRLFGFLQLGEREGSGGPAILRAWSEQHWRTPELVEDVENSELHLKLRLVSLLPEASIDAVRAAVGAAFEAQDELGRVALVTAHAENGVMHARIAGLTTAHPRDITIKLQELVRKGLLVASGPARTRRYALPVGTVESSEESSQGSEETSEESSAGTEETRGWRAMSDQLDAVVVFCTPAWRTLPEIATELGRQPSTVRTMYLRPLLGRGALVRKYPDNPRHPHQAYRAANANEPT